MGNGRQLPHQKSTNPTVGSLKYSNGPPNRTSAMLGAFVDIGFALSPVAGYYPQYKTLVSENKKSALPTASSSKVPAASFSPTIPVILISAHFIRLISCLLQAPLSDGRPSPLALPPSLIIQSFLMIAIQMLILRVIVKSSPFQFIKEFFSSAPAHHHHHHHQKEDDGDDDAVDDAGIDLLALNSSSAPRNRASSSLGDKEDFDAMHSRSSALKTKSPNFLGLPGPASSRPRSSSDQVHPHTAKLLVALAVMVAIGLLNLTLHYTYPVHHDPDYYSVPSPLHSNAIVMEHRGINPTDRLDAPGLPMVTDPNVPVFPPPPPPALPSAFPSKKPEVVVAKAVPAASSNAAAAVAPLSPLPKKSPASVHTALLLSISALLETTIPLPTLLAIRGAKSTRGVNPIMVIGWLGGDCAKCVFYWSMDSRKKAGAAPSSAERSEEDGGEGEREAQEAKNNTSSGRPSPLLAGAILSVALDIVVVYYMFLLYPNSEAKTLIKWAKGTGRHR